METTTRLILTGTLFASAGLAAIPPPMPRPPAESLTQFVKGLSGALTAYEYENAIRDLLDVPWVQIKSKLPQDGESWRFNKIGAALDLSHVQLSRDMSSADYALREAMAAKLLRPPSAINRGAITRIYACQEPSRAVGRVSRIFSDAGGFSWSSSRIPAPGRYQIRAAPAATPPRDTSRRAISPLPTSPAS